MDHDNFIASLLLSKASVAIQPPQTSDYSISETLISAPSKSSARDQFKKLRKRAVFCRAPKNQKALLFSS